MIKKIWNWINAHRVYSLLILAAVVGAGYWGYQKFFHSTATVRYVTGQVERGTLVQSVTGTGQVSASNELTIKAKASGDVTYANVKAGQEVKAGTLLFQLDASDALKSVRDAKTALESAQISLQKLVAPADQLTVLQAQNALSQAQESKVQAQADLIKAYDDGFNTVASAFLDLPTIMNGLKDMLFGNAYSDVQTNLDWYANNSGVAAENYNMDNYNKLMRYHDDVLSSYNSALSAYNLSFDFYKSATRVSSTTTIESLIVGTYETSKKIAGAVKDAKNFLDFVQSSMLDSNIRATIPATMVTHQSSLDSYTSKTNSQLLSLLSIKQTITDSKTSIINSDRTIAEKTESLSQINAGADELDVRSQQLSVQQKQNALLDAQQTLANYSARAPFDGVTASVAVKKGDSVSGGATMGVLITKNQIATIALNEVDIAKVKVGQKVNLSFDAIDNLTITGEVAEVDAIGTVSQGVVSYNVDIAFDVQDSRVKPGMSVSAVVTLDSQSNVLMVASSAVKNSTSGSYVEVLQNGAPVQKPVTVGQSNDSKTEIVSGLNEGDSVITQKLTTTAAAASSSGSSANRSSSSNATRFLMGGPGR